MKRLFQRVAGPFFFGVGCILLYVLIQRIGVSELFGAIYLLGWRVGFVLILPLVWYFFQTLAWFFVLEEMNEHVSLKDLLRIKLVGESVNTLTPVSFMGGDPVRIYLLQKKMPITLSTASIVLDRTMQSLAVVMMLFAGLIVAWATLELPSLWRIMFPCLIVMTGLVLWFFIHRQRKGIFIFFSKVGGRLGLKRHLTESIQEKLGSMDQRISEFYRKSPGRFVSVLVCHFLARMVGVFEILLVAGLMMIPLGLDGSLILATLSVLVNMVFVFIPGSMGVMEGAYGALFILMALNPTGGVALQLIRRLRSAFWVFVGLLFMLKYARSNLRGEVALES